MCKIEQEGLSQCLAIEPTTCPQYYVPRARGSQCLEEHHKMGVSLGGMMGRARLGLRQCQKMGFSPWRWHWSAGGWGQGSIGGAKGSEAGCAWNLLEAW